MKHISDEDLASVLDKARREADGGKQPCTWGLVASALEELKALRKTGGEWLACLDRTYQAEINGVALDINKARAIEDAAMDRLHALLKRSP